MKYKDILSVAYLCKLVYEEEKDIKKTLGKELVQFIEDKGFKVDTQLAMIELENIPNTLIVAFRGTEDPTDFLTDFDARKHDFRALRDQGHDLSVHRGFEKAYNRIRSDIIKTITARGCKSIIITGHSLGGAVAALCALDVKRHFKGREVSCITFGSPRVGDEKFISVFDHFVDQSLRFVNGDDIVTKVPFKRFLWIDIGFGLGFKHVKGMVSVGKGRFHFVKKIISKLKGKSISDHFINSYIRSIIKDAEIDFTLKGKVEKAIK